MKEDKTRIISISIENIKNVSKGTVLLNNVKEDSMGASVIGVYGQNGSGKTSLIWAVDFIKDAISGATLPADSHYYIRQTSEQSLIQVKFEMTIQERIYDVYYGIAFGKTSDRIQIFTETIDYSAKATETLPRINRTRIIGINYPIDSTGLDECFYIPNNRIDEMTKQDKLIRQKLLVLQALAKEKITSFIFNDRMMDLLTTSFINDIYFKILDELRFFARMNLFVLNKNSESSYNMNLLPLSMRLSTQNAISKSDAIPVGLGQNNASIDAFVTIQSIIKQIDLLIGTIVPGLKIDIINKTSRLNEKAEEELTFELASNRNGVITPLRYESEGIKKILCILSSLIAMYNDSSIFVAIDEMDAGIFEYLLGEILYTIRSTGQGQLLFTSHNMRPLEVLDSSSIYFTTTNPDNKYIKFTGIKNNNNLRTTLLRTIDLGGQKESVYETTSTYQIGKAFRKAGGACK